eukprot:gene11540-14134_t
MKNYKSKNNEKQVKELELCNQFQESWPLWRKELYLNGWAIVKNVVPKERVEHYRSEFWTWMEGFGTGINRNSKSTWNNESWPPSLHGILHGYSFAHNQFLWDMRSEESIINIFKEIYKTEKLLVSFDGGNISKPVISPEDVDKPWPHFDQGIKKQGFHCIQGFLNLQECGPHDGGLIVYQGSHLKHREYFEKTPIKNSDFVKIEGDPLKNPIFKDCKKIKVCCESGDFILWDSRTIHYACAPDQKLGSGECRMVVYASYQPAYLATQKDIARKLEAFSTKSNTNHWGAEKVKIFPKYQVIKGVDQKKRFTREDPNPILTERAELLAGLVPYD